MASDDARQPLLQPTTDQVVRDARTMVRTARHAALATAEPVTGWPLCTRVGMTTDVDGAPVILTSRLAAQTGALLAEPRCSLLIGAPGKGDPLAHARLSVACAAGEIERDSADHARLDARYLAHQQKAQLYSGLPDFRYFRLEPRRASLNAGFGRAFALAGAELLAAVTPSPAIVAAEPGLLAHLNAFHAEAVGLLAQSLAPARKARWTLVGIDPEGVDLLEGDTLHRVWFDHVLVSVDDLHATLAQMTGMAGRALTLPQVPPA